MNRARLLVSVRSAMEAQLALQGGASIIDIKEPSRGPLGRADAQTIADIAQVIQLAEHKRSDKTESPLLATSLSVAMGELSELQLMSMAERATLLPASVLYVKIGMAGQAAQEDWPAQLAAMFQCFEHARPVPVAYWDASAVNAPSPDQLLDWAIEHDAAVFLIDTADKTGPGLFEHQDDLPRLNRLLAKAHGHGLPVALAGRLVGRTFEIAADLAREPGGPAIVGVRTAACEQQNRIGVICPHAVAKLNAKLSFAEAAP